MKMNFFVNAQENPNWYSKKATKLINIQNDLRSHGYSMDSVRFFVTLSGMNVSKMKGGGSTLPIL